YSLHLRDLPSFPTRRSSDLGPFARSVSVLAGGTVGAQLLAAVATPVLTRLYSAHDFGCLQLYVSVMAFTTFTATMRYEQAILLPENDELAASLVCAALATVSVISM